MKSIIMHWLAIFLILQTGLIHLFMAQASYEAAAYLGYLFIANFLVALVAATGMYRQRRWGWLLGLSLAAASLVGTAWSRTLGLPGVDIEAWSIPWDLTSILVEVGFVGIVLLQPWRRITTNQVSSLSSVKPSYRSAILMAVMLLLVSGLAFQWDRAAGGTDPMMKASVAKLNRSPSITRDELLQEYGVAVSLVAITAMDSIVDVRLRVIDPEKAHLLLKYRPELFVDEKAIVLAPTMHSHGQLKTGQIYVMFFPTRNHTVQAGSQVSLIFGDLRLQPEVVK